MRQPSARPRGHSWRGQRTSFSVRVLMVLLPASSSTVSLTLTRTRLWRASAWRIDLRVFRESVRTSLARWPGASVIVVTPVLRALAALRNEIVPCAVTRHSSLQVVNRVIAVVCERKCWLVLRANVSCGLSVSFGGMFCGGSTGGGCVGGGVGAGGPAWPPHAALPGQVLSTLTEGELPFHLTWTSA